MKKKVSDFIILAYKCSTHCSGNKKTMFVKGPHTLSRSEAAIAAMKVGEDSILDFKMYDRLGHETTFGSKDSAKSLYDRTLFVFFKQIKREKFVADSVQNAKDSAFRCQHTYE